MAMGLLTWKEYRVIKALRDQATVSFLGLVTAWQRDPRNLFLQLNQLKRSNFEENCSREMSNETKDPSLGLPGPQFLSLWGNVN